MMAQGVTCPVTRDGGLGHDHPIDGHAGKRSWDRHREASGLSSGQGSRQGTVEGSEQGTGQNAGEGSGQGSGQSSRQGTGPLRRPCCIEWSGAEEEESGASSLREVTVGDSG